MNDDSLEFCQEMGDGTVSEHLCKVFIFKTLHGEPTHTCGKPAHTVIKGNWYCDEHARWTQELIERWADLSHLKFYDR